jgi:hypothetical protein
MREPLGPGIRLAITLRYLATGKLYYKKIYNMSY